MACASAVSGSYERGRPRLAGCFCTMLDKILDATNFLQYGTEINREEVSRGSVFCSAGVFDGDAHCTLRCRRSGKLPAGGLAGETCGRRLRLPGGEPDGPGSRVA